jgi:predicted nucleic acid-binding protein
VTFFVLDSSAVLRYLDREAGFGRVREIFRICASTDSVMLISAVQWGEIAAIRRRQYGQLEQVRVLRDLAQFDLQIVAANARRAVQAAGIRVDYKMGSADSYAVELTLDSPESVLVTADYDFKLVQDLIRIEFLPVK